MAKRAREWILAQIRFLGEACIVVGFSLLKWCTSFLPQIYLSRSCVDGKRKHMKGFV